MVYYWLKCKVVVRKKNGVERISPFSPILHPISAAAKGLILRAWESIPLNGKSDFADVIKDTEMGR